jgi:aminocarboxymuconate-semialdehyde decarboxylase
MDAQGIDMAVLTPAPPRGIYRETEDKAAAIANAVNDFAAGVAAQFPDRLVTFGIIPMQHAAASVAVMQRGVKELGLKGFRIATNIAGLELDNPGFEDIYAAAEELDAMIYTHPQGFTQPDRLADFNMANVVGNPLDSTLSVSHLIFGGVLERHPRLKVFISHGGGYFPFYLGRFDHAFEARAECRTHISKPPREYMKRLYFDTVVFKPEMVAYLAQSVGVEKIMMGTDRPYDMGENEPIALVDAVPGLSDADRAAIKGGNAAALFGIG